MIETYPVVVNNPNWAELVQWLQENVGDLFWSRPIIEWHGNGWYMRSTPMVNQRGLSSTPCFTVKFEDSKSALMFALKWT